MKQQEFFGYGSISNLGKILEKEKIKQVFLVTGRDSFEKCNAKQTLDNLLKNYKVMQFNGFSSNPKLEDITSGFKIFEKGNFDAIIAVGGGSVIDVAKAIKLFYSERYEE